MRAYVLLKAGSRGTTEVMSGLRNKPEVVEAAVIHGPYDCVAHVEGPDVQSITETVFRIREIPGVADSLTCLVVQSWRRT